MPDRGIVNRLLPWISSPILLAIFLWDWQLIVSYSGVSPFLLPSPAEVGKALRDMLADGSTWGHIQVTLVEVLLGFAIAVVVGIVLGAILGRMVWLERAVQPAMVAFQVLPKIALVPIFVILFGYGITSKIVVTAILAFFPIMLNVLLGVRSVDRGHRDVMRGLGASRWQTFRDLELPNTLPYVFAGAEVGIVFAVIGAVVGEYLGANKGLGQQIVVRLNALDAPGLYAVIVLLAALGTILYFGVSLTKRFVIPWHESVVGQ